jgi:hypothetical protein
MNGLSKKMAASIAAVLSIGIAACESKVTPATAKGVAPTWSLHTDGVDVLDAATTAKLRSIRLPGWVWANELYACPPVLALGPNGEALVSSNVQPVIWRIDPASFEVTRHELALDDRGRDVGFSGVAWSGRQGAYFAASGLDGSLWRIDRDLERAQRVPLSGGMPSACGLRMLSDDARNPAQFALCVRTERGDWTVTLSPDHRSGHARPAPCAADAIASSTPMQNATFHAK